jgi:hypothetical protein
MTSTMATTNKIAIYGDFSNFLIADRIGGTIELIPHLFGATSRFPMGQRGLYYYWRVGSDVLVQNAFRYLEVLKMAPKMVRANRSFAAVAGEVEHFVREGELLPTTHRLVKAHPELFGTPKPVVEQTTAQGKRTR